MSVAAADIRFPTSLDKDGSDAIVSTLYGYRDFSILCVSLWGIVGQN